MYTPKTFTFGNLEGLSQKQIDVHIKLYEGYVKFLNTLEVAQADMVKDSEKNAYALGEVTRRIGFEFNGMRNHEIYFDSLSDGAKEISQDSELYKSTAYLWGSFDTWLNRFKSIALSRGIGWAMLYFDKKEMRLLNAYVEDHQLGQLVGCTPILALDMLEHAFVSDYQPSGKKQYVEDFFTNLNWTKIEKNLEVA